jgi:DNA-binding transcriptional LysR family regulator
MQDFQMKDLDWNDLRYILYASRTGRIASTAQMLRVNETTVARRIAHVERLLGARLFERNAGVLAPTDSGNSLSVEPNASNLMSRRSKTL